MASFPDKLTPLQRDLLRSFFEHERGFYLTGCAALTGALAKDGGCTPATLAWVLSQINVPDTAVLPAGLPPAELRTYLDGLVKRLLRGAAPPGTS